MAMPLAAVATAIFGWLKGFSILKILTILAAYTATKILLTTIFTITLAVVMHNFFIGFITDLMVAASEYLSAEYDIPEVAVHFTGLSAWLADQLQLPQVVSVILSAVMVRFSIAFIPIIGR